MEEIEDANLENNFTRNRIRATFLNLASLYYIIHCRRVDFQK